MSYRGAATENLKHYWLLAYKRTPFKHTKNTSPEHEQYT